MNFTVDNEPEIYETDFLLQSTQDLLQYQPVYQGQAALTHSPTSVGQAPSSAQINQYLTQASQSQAAPLAQYSDPNAHLRG